MMNKDAENPRILNPIFSVPKQIKFYVLVRDLNLVNG